MDQADDYQALAAELGLEDPGTVNNNPAPGTDNNDSGSENPTGNDNPPAPQGTDPGANPDDNNPEGANGGNANPQGNPANDNPDNEEAQRQARAFAEMRTTIGKYKKVFGQLQQAMGVDSEDAVIERLFNAGLNVQARKQNVDPDVLRRMQTLEEQNLVMINEQRQRAVIESFGLLQKDFNLTNKEVMDFAKELDDRKIDIYKLGVDLSTLYRGLHYDAISKKQIEAAKQDWIAEGAAANNAPGINPATGKKQQQGKTEINTMGELDNILNSFNKNK